MIDSFSQTDLAAWANLMEVDRLTVIPIVDNETDGLSSPCLACDPTKPGWSGASSYQSEFSSLTKVNDHTRTDIALHPAVPVLHADPPRP